LHHFLALFLGGFVYAVDFLPFNKHHFLTYKVFSTLADTVYALQLSLIVSCEQP